MNKFFNLDTPIMIFLGNLADLIILNLLFLLCSLPIISAGISWTALCYAVRKLHRGEGHAIKNFFSAWKSNGKLALGVSLILAAVGAFLYLDWTFLYNGLLPIPSFFRPFLIGFALLFWLVICLVFPLISRFENTWRQTLKNALFMGIRHLPRTLPVMLLHLLLPSMILFRPDWFLHTLILWIFVGFALLAWTEMWILEGMFQKYM